MNTIKFTHFSLNKNERVKELKNTGISAIVEVGDCKKSFTIIGQRAMPQLVCSLNRTTTQKPTGFTETEAAKISKALTEEEFNGLPTPYEISQVISKVSLSKYIK